MIFSFKNIQNKWRMDRKVFNLPYLSTIIPDPPSSLSPRSPLKDLSNQLHAGKRSRCSKSSMFTPKNQSNMGHESSFISRGEEKSFIDENPHECSRQAVGQLKELGRDFKNLKKNLLQKISSNNKKMRKVRTMLRQMSQGLIQDSDWLKPDSQIDSGFSDTNNFVVLSRTVSRSPSPQMKKSVGFAFERCQIFGEE